MNITLEDVRQRYMQATGREVPPDTTAFAKTVLSQLAAGEASAVLVWAIICDMLGEDARQQIIIDAMSHREDSHEPTLH